LASSIVKVCGAITRESAKIFSHSQDAKCNVGSKAGVGGGG